MSESATDQLRHEHEVVLVVVEAMEREASDIERTGRVHVQRVEQMIDFTRNFTDGCHHRKEENALFPVLEERDPAAGGGQVSILLSEHEAGREAVGQIADALPRADGDAGAREVVARNLAVYAQLLRLHIAKENDLLFPLAERVLSLREQEMLAEEFERIEEEETGAGLHERYHALAHALAEPAGD